MSDLASKWLPVIDRDHCKGCKCCVEACDPRCLGLVWDCATLLRADGCDSDGSCVDACPESLIRMEWVPIKGNAQKGRWLAPGVQRAP